jgi:hypothetical protein
MPNGRKITQHFPCEGSRLHSKVYPNWNFLFEIPSGNPACEWALQGLGKKSAVLG